MGLWLGMNAWFTIRERDRERVENILHMKM